jgi:hypothetical protein
MLLGYVAALQKEHLRRFLREHEERITGNKVQLVERLQQALDTGATSYEELVELLDEIEPWGKQHVTLYDAPSFALESWKDTARFHARLKEHRLGKYLNKTLPLILPPKLALSTIEHTPERLRVVAVERREAWERDEDRDLEDETEEGSPVELRAFVHQVTRGIIAFDWDLVSNTAMLQITQLPTRFRYEHAVERFRELVKSWLDVDAFPQTDLSPAIRYLYKRERNDDGLTRSHGIDYSTAHGRRLSGRSASAKDPLLGETVIDDALDSVCENGVGRQGNFYWLPAADGVNPLKDEVHVIVLAEQRRINFPTPNDEVAIRYVLQGLRAACEPTT